MSKRTTIIQTADGPVLVDSAELLDRVRDGGSKPTAKSKPTPKRSPSKPTAAELAKAARMEREAQRTSAAYFARQRGETGAFEFSDSLRRTSPSNPAAGERLEDAAKRLGIEAGRLAELTMGKVEMTARDGELYLRHRDLDRVEVDLRRSGAIREPDPPSEAAKPEPESYPEMTSEGIVTRRNSPETVEPEPPKPTGGELRATASNRKRLGKPQRWNARPWARG